MSSRSTTHDAARAGAAVARAGAVVVAGAAVLGGVVAGSPVAAPVPQVQHDVTLTGYFGDMLSSVGLNLSFGELLPYLDPGLSATSDVADLLDAIHWNGQLADYLVLVGLTGDESLGGLMGGVSASSVIDTLAWFGVHGTDELGDLLTAWGLGGNEFTDGLLALVGLDDTTTVGAALTTLLDDTLDQLLGTTTVSGLLGDFGLADVGDLLGLGIFDVTDATKIGDYLDMVFAI